MSFRGSATIIDHVWTNRPEIVACTGILLTDVTDHFTPFIQCKGKSECRMELSFTCRDFNNIDELVLCQNMTEAVDYLSIGTNENPNTAYNMVLKYLSKVIDECVPHKTVILRKIR